MPAGQSVTYAIDPLGRRTGKFINGALQWQLLWLDTLRPLAQIKPDGSLDAVFLYGDRPNVPELMVRAGVTYRLLTDHLGSVRLVLRTDTTTPQDLVAQRIDYDPWGRVTFDSNPGFQPFGYAGGLYDPDTGLTRFGARDYDGETARWTSKDPIGFAGGDSSLYAYADGSPLTKTDPLGLATYICKRPLGGSPGSYAPPLLNHTYVCVGSGANMTCGSTTASSGGAMSNIFSSSPGKPTSSVTDYYKPEACEARQGDDSCIETCIANELKKPTRPRYGVGPSGTDCQEYTEDVVSTCEKRCVRR